ncbi:MAG TPA: hypothetical protein VIT67_16430 [Povalibacter sp.]
MRSRLGLILCVFSLLAALAGCGGSDGGAATTPPPTSNNPPPPPPPPPPAIGADGGTVTEVSGAQVIVPAGAIDTDTTIRIAMDSTGAPALPEGLTSAGNTYVITPHGGEFRQPVEVHIPAPTVTLLPTQELKLAKAQPGGEWEVLTDSAVAQGMLSGKVSSFSFFAAVIINYPLPILQFEPFAVTTKLDCGNQPCDKVLGPVTATFSITDNNGQPPAGCLVDQLLLRHAPSFQVSGPGGVSLPKVPIARNGSITVTSNPPYSFYYGFSVGMSCSYSSFSSLRGDRYVVWSEPPSYPKITVVQMPGQLDVVEGMPATLDALLQGGASMKRPNSYSDVTSPATAADRGIIDWQRSDDNGASWRVIARSYENEATPLPFGVGVPWRPWSVRHGFVATSTDQGALIRTQACYTPLDVAALPCDTSAATRINVLQQSALPAIVTPPRSMLVRTGQTANLSATASGLPAPTLQWQTRTANSSADWSNVTTGNGPTTANYITAPLALTDNGTQYRVVATNALGSVESAAVTVSVSDIDVAPTIATQPGSLTVTAGSDAVFAIVATGTEALSYQWRFNGTPIAGANSAVLRLDAVNNASAGSYSVTVSNDAGDADSNVATLKVGAGTPVAVAPTIVTQPAAVTVNAGNTATFAVGIDGSGPFSFQWRRDGVVIPGATSAVLTLDAVRSTDAASYSVVVGNTANPSGIASNAAVLTVTTGAAVTVPSIVTQPATLVVARGGSGVLAVAATGSGPLSYQWLADGVPIGGETEAVLMVTNATESYVGRYAVSVSNSLGTVVSQEVQVILLGAPLITQEPAAAAVTENETATFSVAANGPGLRYQWLLNGLAISGANESSYTTSMLTPANSGAVYSVIVYNGAGVALSQSAVLTVLAFTPPTVAEHPVNTTIDPGSAATLCAAFGGTPPFTVNMTRWSGTAWLPVLAARTVNDNSEACMTTSVLQLSDNGAQFRFEAASGPGLAFTTNTNPATITVRAPAITVTTLASRATNGAIANNNSIRPSLSADGNLVAFRSDGTNLIPVSNFSPGNAYVRDVAAGVTTLISRTPAGSQSIYGVNGLKLAAGGRYAIFSSMSDDLVADDTNGSQDVFVHDLQTGTTTRVSLRADGSQVTNAGNGQSDMQLDISADGRFVSFVSTQDLIGNEPAGAGALYLRNMQTGSLRRVASSATYWVSWSALSGNGEHLVYAFGTYAPTPAVVTHYDIEANVSSTLFTLDTSNGADYLSQALSISGNGRYVAFSARSPALSGGSSFPQIFAIDRNSLGSVILVSTGINGVGNEASHYPVVSDDGHVLFSTYAPNLTENVAFLNSPALVVRDLQNSASTVASRRPNGTIVRSANEGHALSTDGTVIALGADAGAMGDGDGFGVQVYVAPRP